MKHIVIVGSGHLAHALWEGWQRTPAENLRFLVLARSEDHRHLWSQEDWEKVTFDSGCVSSADVLVLTVKPKDAEIALEHLSPLMRPDVVVLSAIAGWPIERLRQFLPAVALVRLMPNICAAVGASVTLFAADKASAEERELAESLLEALGPTHEIDQSLMNPLTALVGSGPAYLYAVLAAVMAGGAEMGVDPVLSRTLVAEMMEGASRLARAKPQDTLESFVSHIASPGGTTEALLGVLASHNWSEVLRDAVVAAGQRAHALGKPS